MYVRLGQGPTFPLGGRKLTIHFAPTGLPAYVDPIYFDREFQKRLEQGGAEVVRDQSGSGVEATYTDAAVSQAACQGPKTIA